MIEIYIWIAYFVIYFGGKFDLKCPRLLSVVDDFLTNSSNYSESYTPDLCPLFLISWVLYKLRINIRCFYFEFSDSNIHNLCSLYIKKVKHIIQVVFRKETFYLFNIRRKFGFVILLNLFNHRFLLTCYIWQQWFQTRLSNRLSTNILCI